MPNQNFISIREASRRASIYLGREITKNNISYLIQYGKILRYNENGKLKNNSSGSTRVSWSELKKYYSNQKIEQKWKEVLGDGINWRLSFFGVPERKTTKHVHRLHQYKGKFIPQLVEYFLDEHKNDFKKNVFFKQGDVILDPFVGSGTTLVQCLELGLNSIGVDISKFNCIISRVKTKKYDLQKVSTAIQKAYTDTYKFSKKIFHSELDSKFRKFLSTYNYNFYPNPDFKILIALLYDHQARMRKKVDLEINSGFENRNELSKIVLKNNLDENQQIERRVNNFLSKTGLDFKFNITPNNLETIVNAFTRKYEELVLEKINNEWNNSTIKQQTKLFKINQKPFDNSNFISSWFTERQQSELNYYLQKIVDEEDPAIKDVMRIILSRTARSCRATKHVDLATLVKPQSEPYYCKKHYKICIPVRTILRHLKKYTNDTIKRIETFSRIRKDVFCETINGDSRTLNIFEHIKKTNKPFYEILTKNKINGIFTSPPYVGQIDYHEQHAYSYELFDIDRKDELEIGKKSKGKGITAQLDYVNGIASVLRNVKQFLRDDAKIFVVANDKLNLYDKIAEESGLIIENVYRRPVLNRTERDKQPYSESIFQMSIKSK